MPDSGATDRGKREKGRLPAQALKERVRSLERRLAEEVSLSDVQQRLLSSADVEQVAATLLDMAPELTACERCRLAVRAEDGWECWDRSLGGTVQHYRLGPKAGFPEEGANGGGPTIRSPWTEGRDRRVELSTRLKLQSYVALPVTAPRRQVGIFEAANFVHPEEIEQHADILGEMLTSAAAAIDLARLHTELGQRAEEAELAARRIGALQEVTEVAISSLSLDGLIRELLNRIRKVLDGDTATILLLAEDGENLAVRASSGLEEEVKEHVTVPVGKGFAGRIAASRKPTIVEDVSQAEIESPFLREKVRSLIGAPLMVEDRVTGVLHVGTVKKRQFSGDDVRLLQLVADRAASAIERKRAEEAVRKLSRAVEQSPVSVVITDLRGNIEYVNPKFTQVTGYTVEEVLGKNSRILKSGHTPPEEYRRLWTTITSGREWRGEFLNKKKNGEFIWEAASISPITDEEGTITHFLEVKEDISERKQAEKERERLLEQLRETNGRLVAANTESQRRAAELDATIDSIADGVIIFGPAGEAVRMNGTAERMLGLRLEQLRLPQEERIRLLRMETPDGAPLPLEEAPAVRAARGETVRGYVMIIHSLDGRTLWVAASAAPIRAPDGGILGSVVTLTDITELHELQEQREDLVRMVSHDLRIPLTSVQGQAQLLARLLERSGQDGQLRRSAEAIAVGTRRMNAMIQDLVDVARVESRQLVLKRTRVDVRSFVLDLKQRMVGVLDTDRIQVEIPEGLPPVWADPDRLERVLTNLLSNALKYSRPDTEVRVMARKLDPELQISVSDRGAGIPAGDIPHLFDRFYRVKGTRKAEGLGLGLYISRMLVEAMGGRIWVESQPGKGSTFNFTLPIA